MSGLMEFRRKEMAKNTFLFESHKRFGEILIQYLTN